MLLPPSWSSNTDNKTTELFQLDIYFLRVADSVSRQSKFLSNSLIASIGWFHTSGDYSLTLMHWWIKLSATKYLRLIILWDVAKRNKSKNAHLLMVESWLPCSINKVEMWSELPAFSYLYCVTKLMFPMGVKCRRGTSPRKGKSWNLILNLKGINRIE